LPKQILLNNLLTDFPDTAIARDKVDPEMINLIVNRISQKKNRPIHRRPRPCGKTGRVGKNLGRFFRLKSQVLFRIECQSS
jgi:hypothetical protein